jgi:hypothetical protein
LPEYINYKTAWIGKSKCLDILCVLQGERDRVFSSFASFPSKTTLVYPECFPALIFTGKVSSPETAAPVMLSGAIIMMAVIQANARKQFMT